MRLNFCFYQKQLFSTVQQNPWFNCLVYAAGVSLVYHQGKCRYGQVFQFAKKNQTCDDFAKPLKDTGLCRGWSCWLMRQRNWRVFLRLRVIHICTWVYQEVQDFLIK